MTGKEYLEQQVHPFGYNDKISTLTYPEEDCARCPFCNKELKGEFIDSKFVLKRCDCKDSKEEEQVNLQLEEIKSKIEKLQLEYNEKKEKWGKHVFDRGMRYAAMNYMYFAANRALFDSQIEEFTK